MNKNVPQPPLPDSANAPDDEQDDDSILPVTNPTPEHLDFDRQPTAPATTSDQDDPDTAAPEESSDAATTPSQDGRNANEGPVDVAQGQGEGGNATAGMGSSRAGSNGTSDAGSVPEQKESSGLKKRKKAGKKTDASAATKPAGGATVEEGGKGGPRRSARAARPSARSMGV